MSSSTLPGSSAQDWDDLNKQYPKSSMLKLVLQSFLKHHGNSAAEIRLLMTDPTVEPLAKLAHKLKGAACMMRAHTMIKMAESVENQIRATGEIDAAQAEALAASMDTWVNDINNKLQAL